jgi:hypothetical protein
MLRLPGVPIGCKDIPRHVDTYRLYRKARCGRCARRRLPAAMTTRELAVTVMKAKSLDVGDQVLAKGIGPQLIHVLRMRHQTGRLVMTRKRAAMSVWQLPPPAEPASLRNQ